MKNLIYSRLPLPLKYDRSRRFFYKKHENSENFIKWSYFVLNSDVYQRLVKIKKENYDVLKKLNEDVCDTLTHKHRNKSITRIRNHCRISKGSHSISRNFRLSRSTFKEQIKKNQRFVGVTSFPFSKKKNTIK